VTDDSSPQPLLAAQGVTVRFGDRIALREVDFRVTEGERVALIGPSGAGKSTLLRVLNGSVQPDGGSVHALGTELAALRGAARRRVLREIGTVYQQLALVGPLRVAHNVSAGHLGRWPLWRAGWSLVAPGAAPDAAAALARVGLRGREREQTWRLSGGEQQRVAVARLLIQSPRAVLADEPIASLDQAHAEEVVDLLLGLEGATVIVALHDVGLARERFDRIVALRAGRVAFDLRSGNVDAAALRSLYELEPR
jgi:phosphonate transport system ATP-binding protein